MGVECARFGIVAAIMCDVLANSSVVIWARATESRDVYSCRESNLSKNLPYLKGQTKTIKGVNRLKLRLSTTI